MATTRHFVFYSDFATNLNDALIVTGAARNAGEPELLLPDTEEATCLAGLPPSTLLGWNLAVDYYAAIISPVSWSDRQQYLLRLDLAGIEEDLDARSRSFAGIARGFRAAAAPAYGACGWPAQDAANRRWIDELMPRLTIQEETIAGRLEQLYQTPWHGLPIRVDVVSAAPPQGANSIVRPPHILVSSAIRESDALEIVFHEASHTLMRGTDPLPQALAEAAKTLDMKLPGDLSHVLLFYTTGEAVRRILQEGGEPDHIPFLYTHELWHGSWGRYREPVEKVWPAYLDGDRTLSEATLDLLRTLSRADEPHP